jgi:hypothetical protein
MVRKSVLVAAALVATAIAAPRFEDAYAAVPKKELVKGKFGRKRFKGNLPNAQSAHYITSTQGIEITGSSLHGFTQGVLVLVAGSVPDPRTATYPVTLTDVVGSFAILSPKKGLGWVSEGTMTITLTGYDAATTRLTGTFAGTMVPGDTTPGGTIDVTKGKFSVDLEVQ